MGMIGSQALRNFRQLVRQHLSDRRLAVTLTSRSAKISIQYRSLTYRMYIRAGQFFLRINLIDGEDNPVYILRWTSGKWTAQAGELMSGLQLSTEELARFCVQQLIPYAT